MDSITKLTCKQPPLLFLHHHNHHHKHRNNHNHHHHYSHRPSFSSISFKTQSFPHSLSSKSSSFKTKSISLSSNPNPSQNPQIKNPFPPLFSLLKIPLCVTVAATALFVSGFGPFRPLIAVAAPAPAVEESTDTAAEEAGAAAAEEAAAAEAENDGVSDEEKEKALEEHVASHPDDLEALRSLMEVKLANKKLPEAVKVINRLIELEPDELEWLILRAHMYTYMDESRTAKAMFEEILAKNPLCVEAYHGIVMAVSPGESDSEWDGKELEEVAKRIQEAWEMCRKQKLKDEMRDFRLLIAQIRVIQGDYNEALKVYQELVKEEPRDFRPYLCQGIIYTLLRKTDEAQKQFDTYKRLVPEGHPYAQYFDDNVFATKTFSQMAENERMKVGSKA